MPSLNPNTVKEVEDDKLMEVTNFKQIRDQFF